MQHFTKFRFHWQGLDTQFEPHLELLRERISGHCCNSVRIPDNMPGDLFAQHWFGIECTSMDSSVCAPVAHLHDINL